MISALYIEACSVIAKHYNMRYKSFLFQINAESSVPLDLVCK